MNQLKFDFVQTLLTEQLELFSDSIYDNRVKRLEYGIKLSYNLNRWRPNTVDSITECVRMFKVNSELVLKKYDDFVCQLQSRWESQGV